MKNLSNRVKNERKKRNMTQKEFAKFTGSSSATISVLENGQSVSEDTIHKVANALQWTDGVYADYTLGISKEESEAIVKKVEENMKRLNLTQPKMVKALGISLERYRKWRRDMTPYGKRELLKFARMDKETYEQAIEEYNNQYIKKYDSEPLYVDKNPLSGEELKELRTSRGWTQFKLSEKIGIDPSAIPKWERGDVAIPKTRIKQLYLLFDLPYDEVKREYKTEAQRKQEHIQRKEILRRLDLKTEQWHTLPDDDPDLVQLRELVGA